MKIKLLRDAAVRYSAGQELEVDEREAVRLASLGLAEPVKAAVKKTTTKRKEG